METLAYRMSPTRRLTIFYVCALISVALLVIIGQIIIQMAIQQQTSDAFVINIAGRQRMLSQKISKDALILQSITDPTTRSVRIQELQQAVTLWQQSQQGLQNGDPKLGLPATTSTDIKQSFIAIDPNFQAMLSAANTIITLVSQHPELHPDISTPVSTILAQESPFLTGMNQIVTQYQQEADGRVSSLRNTELILLGLTLVVLIVEGSFVFRPTARKLQQTITEIVELQQSIQQQKHELESGIQLILQTHVQVANGDFTTRAPLTQDHLLWQVAYSLNNLLARLQNLSQAEANLQRAKIDFTRQIGSTQVQVQQVKAELQQIGVETTVLVDALREAKVKDHPIWAPPSRTLLIALYQELIGNYLQPSPFPPVRRNQGS